MADMENLTLTLPTGEAIPYIAEQAYIQTMREVVEPELKRLRREADTAVAGGTLHTESYVIPGAKRAIVLVHGYTESAEKLRELTWYFIKAGFSVFAYDHRGHGRSLRLVPDTSLTHVENFSDYVDDLERVIEDVVRPAMGDAPLYLFAHSMGGAVGAHYLLRHPDTFCRAILNSPMIAPSAAPFPLWVGYSIAQTMCLTGKAKERAFIAGPFDPAKETFPGSNSTSEARFDYYQAKRNSTPYLQNCSPTYRWVRESVKQTSTLLKSRAAAKVKTKVLLCQAGLDNVVLLPEQEQFVSRLPDARLVCFDAAKHEIYNSKDDVMQPYMQTMLDFLLKD